MTDNRKRFGNLQNKKSFNLYLEEIGQFPLIDRETEIELAKRIQEGDETALTKLVLANLRLVVYFVKRYKTYWFLWDELIDAGNEGLKKASRSYNGKIKFCTFAGWHIRNAIHREIIRYHRTKKLCPLSLNQPFNSDNNDSRTLLNLIEDNSQNPETLSKKSRLNTAIKKVLTTLPQQERQVIELYFGLNGNESLTLRKIAAQVGLTFARIGQIKDKAMKRLKHPSRSRLLATYLNI